MHQSFCQHSMDPPFSTHILLPEEAKTVHAGQQSNPREAHRCMRWQGTRRSAPHSEPSSVVPSHKLMSFPEVAQLSIS